MAVTYTGAGGLFTHLGPVVARIREYEAIGLTDLPADLALLLASFGTTWLPHEGVAAQFEAYRRDVDGWRQRLAQLGDRRLVDFPLVASQLRLPEGAGVGTVLPALWRDMLDGSKRVKANACTVGTVTPHASNNGNGTAFVTLTLDGYNAPLAGGLSLVQYDGLRSELCVPSETMTLECTADSQTDGIAEGAESWAWYGGPAYAPYDCRGEGSGQGPGLFTCDEGSNLLAGGSMDSWSGSTPSGWTVSTGSAAVSQSAATCHRGTSSMKVAGGTATVRIEQAVSSLVQGRRRYHLGFAVKASGAASAATVRAYLGGTGYASFGVAELDGASLSTSWQLVGGFGTVPSPIPGSLKLYVEVLGLPSGTDVYIDSVHLVPAVYHGGLGAVVKAGSSPWLRGDKLTWAVTNDAAGKFQTHARRWWRTQLPSVKAGSSQGYFLGLPFTLMLATTAETVADSLVA